jgi:putative ABC transport system permease protein
MFLALFNEAWISIGTNRLRAFLAMLGIVIGVGSVVLMLAIGAGSKHVVEKAIASLGSNILIITPGITVNNGVHSNALSELDLKDPDAIAGLDSVLAAAPATYPRSFQIASGKLNWSTQVTGTTPDYFTVRDWIFSEGQPFTGDDVRLGHRVAVIGATVAANIFPEEDPLGRAMQLNGAPYQIVGVLETKGQGLDGRDQDDAVFVPIITAKTHLWGQTFFSSIVELIYVKTVSAETMESATDDIISLLRQRHRVREGADNDVLVHNLASITQVASDTAQALSLLLGAIASISLVVGSIGIMNIMLVTVTERTREIGIRKAIGATEHHILLQYLMEAIMISCVGSMVGLMVGFAGGMAAETWFFVTVEYSVWFVVLALTVAVGIGVISGIYPAYKAAKMQPIDALRTVVA